MGVLAAGLVGGLLAHKSEETEIVTAPTTSTTEAKTMTLVAFMARGMSTTMPSVGKLANTGFATSTTTSLSEGELEQKTIKSFMIAHALFCFLAVVALVGCVSLCICILFKRQHRSRSVGMEASGSCGTEDDTELLEGGEEAHDAMADADVPKSLPVAPFFTRAMQSANIPPRQSYAPPGYQVQRSVSVVPMGTVLRPAGFFARQPTLVAYSRMSEASSSRGATPSVPSVALRGPA